MKKNLLFVLTLMLVCSAQAQQKYKVRDKFYNIQRPEFLKHADSMFFFHTEFSYNFSTNFSLPYTEINPDQNLDQAYLDRQLKLIAKDSLNPYPFSNVALYYQNRGNTGLANQYYNKALKKMPFFNVKKDSAAFYSYRGVLKYNVGLDGMADIEKALYINNADSLAVAMYPMFVINNKPINEVRSIMLSTLDNKKMKYLGYFLLNMAEFQDAYSRFSGSDNWKKEIGQKNISTIINMDAYDKYFDSNDERFIKQKQMGELLNAVLKMMPVLLDDDLKPAPDDLAFMRRKESYFKKLLKQKNANTFAAYVGLATINYLSKHNTEALNYYLKALQEFPAEKEGFYFNTLTVYDNMASIYNHDNNLDKAIEVLMAKLKVKTLAANEKALTLLNLGKLYMAKGNYDKANDYGREALEVQESFDVDLFLSYACYRLTLGTMSQRYIDKAQAMIGTENEACRFVTYLGILSICNGSFDVAYEHLAEIRKSLTVKKCEECQQLLDHYLVLSN